MRIYELAKELGVDNRVIIARAAELGFSGKSSHSNSLDPDEADMIRRAIIRQAMGAPSEREKVTTRVDKVTGETESIVEKRKGNVIRRRKSVGDTGGSSSAGDLTSHVEAEAAVPVEDSALTVEGEEGSGEAEPVAPQSEPEVIHAEIAEEVTEEVAPIAAEVSRAPTAAPEKKAVAAAPATPEEERKGVGPKVLGKIELPQRKVVRPEARRAGVVGGVPTTRTAPAPAPAVADEGDGKPSSRKVKGRKRELSRADLVDYDGLETRRAPRRGPREQLDKRRLADPSSAQRAQQKRVVRIDETILVGDLAKQMSVKAGDVIAKLMELGVLATINQPIDKDTAQIIAEEFGAEIQSTSFDEQEILHEIIADEETARRPRPPIVTVMGHVDHGKTSLLDTIRKTSVAAKEHGGITQHIGAYTVELPDGRKVTFIDTPGHAAFTAMRARGAQVTDIVVLVVAADDGVMPQTIEAINHAKAAQVSILVAVNKMDKPGANIDRIKQQLAEHGVQPEEWGGDSIFIPVSAIKGTGIKELLEALLLIAEVKELRANPERRALGTIIEARQDRGRGTVATVLVQNGTLRVGDIFVAGAESGRIRSMSDDRGNSIDAAGPSIAAEITGFGGMPEAGDDFFVVESESSARQVSASRGEKRAAKERLLASGPISLEEFAKRANNAAALELNVVLKADVHGSVGAVAEALEKLSTPKVKVRVLHSAVGAITESDVQLATASKAIIVGFGVRAEPRTIMEAEKVGVELRFYRIIYELIDDIKLAMAGMLPKIRQESALGRAEVRNTFVIPKHGMIAGCFVADGLIRRAASVRLLRDNKVVYEGKIGSLRRFKDDVREVQTGFECGIGIEGYGDVKVGDIMEVFDIKEVAATLE